MTKINLLLLFLASLFVSEIIAQKDIPKIEDTPCASSAIVVAAENNQLEEVQQLLKLGCDVNSKAKYGRDGFRSALVWAGMHDNLDMARLLLVHGADPNLDLGSHPTPFIYAATAWQSLAFFSQLLEKGGNVNAIHQSDDDGFLYSILQYAAGGHIYGNKGSIEKVKLLVENGAIINPRKGLNEQSPLVQALGQAEILQYLFEYGADVNATHSYFSGPSSFTGVEHNLSLLHDVVNDSTFKPVDWATLEILVENGININAEADRGTTSLFIAAGGNNFKLVDFLLEHGAVFQNEYDSALHHAVLFSNVAMVEYLLTKGARVDISDKFGASLLFACYGCCGDGFGDGILEENRVKVIELLLDKGANPNAKYQEIPNPYILSKTFLEIVNAPYPNRKEVRDMLVKQGLISEK